jgi:general secretion pathway protein K
VKAEAQVWKTNIWRNERGMALLITIMTVALLVAVTVQYHKTTWNKFLAAHNFQRSVQLTTIAESGMNIAVTVLQNDAAKNDTDSFLDSWALLANEQFDGLFPTGTLKIRIDDLSGRLPINNLVGKKGDGQKGVDTSIETESREILFRLLLSGAFPVDDETQARGIVDAIIDWIDADDNESDYGAENSYYQSLEQPYACRNQPLQYIEELLLIRGVTPALLFGSDKAPGLVDYLTVYGTDGKINLNTAPPLLIQNLEPLISDELIEKFDNFRKDKENAEQLSRPDWYKNIRGWPGDIVLNESLMTTKSTYFQVNATGVLDTLSRTMVASVERVNTDEVKLIVNKME